MTQHIFDRTAPRMPMPKSSAKLHNALVDIAERYIARPFSGGNVGKLGESEVWVYNTSTTDTIAQYMACTVGDPAILPEDNNDVFRQFLMLEASAPVTGSYFAIAQEPITPLSFGRAKMAGLSHAWVDDGTVVGNKLDVLSSQNYLSPAAGGTVEALWVDSTVVDGAVLAIVAIGKTNSTAPTQTTIIDSVTNNVTNYNTIIHNSTGTPATNFGIQETTKLESSTTESRDAWYDKIYWTTATDATRTSVREFWAALNGTMVNVVTFGPNYSEFFYPLRTDALTVQDNFILQNIVSPTQITSNQNDYAPTGNANSNILRISTDAPRTLTGLSAAGFSGSAIDGRIVVILNVGSYTITLANQSASSTAANRFLFGYDYRLTPNTAIALVYDNTSARWRFFTGFPAPMQSVVRNDAEFTKSTDTTLEVIPGLEVNVLAGKTYRFRAVVHQKSADVSGGTKYAINGTCTATSISYFIVLVDESSLANTIAKKGTALGEAGEQTGTDAGFCSIDGCIEVNAAGTLNVEFAQSVANGFSAVRANSTFEIWEII